MRLKLGGTGGKRGDSIPAANRPGCRGFGIHQGLLFNLNYYPNILGAICAGSYFLYSRKLLGKLSLAAWETVREVFVDESGCDEAVPAMISGIQTFGDLINWHPHIHAIVPCGVFLKNGDFVVIDGIPTERFLAL